MNALQKNKHIWLNLIYGVLYLTAFVFLEQSQASIHTIHTKWDDYIPFCEYLIVPYLLGFVFVVAAWLYFGFVNADRKEYYQLM